MAKNLVFDDVEGLSVTCDDPATPKSGDPVRVGQMTGVALNDEDANGVTVVDFDDKVWNLSVKGVDGSGNSAVAIGDKLYYVDADTPKISKKATGYLFGFALEAITSGSTKSINVVKVMA
jgi:predicted RecA/RadA family phage recombinase